MASSLRIVGSADVVVEDNVAPLEAPSFGFGWKKFEDDVDEDEDDPEEDEEEDDDDVEKRLEPLLVLAEPNKLVPPPV